jgi:LuxR family transcriptional regulator, maltose regulon positive regulatory protein
MSVGASLASAVPRSRLGPPRLPADLVSRPRLLRRLDEWAGMLCVVAAPAGFGKTTLLAEWARNARRGRVAWLSIDEGEAEPTVFWADVAVALGGMDRGVDDATLAGAIALAETSGAQALVVDGYERIAGSPAEAELWRFVAERPPLQLVVAGRGEPSEPLAGARARGEVLELRAADLRFDRGEARELVGCRPGGDLVDACAGWPAALRLALSASSPRLWEDRLLELVTEEILTEPAARTFLTSTALLGELSPTACDTVLGVDGSEATLADLERRNLLVERSGADGRYRLEPAARRALRAELERTDRQLASRLHRRAAAAEHAAGRDEGAVEHLLACGDTAAARRLVAAIWERVADSGRQAQVLDWLERLPQGGTDVRLALARGWLLRLDGRRPESERWLDAALAAAPIGLRPAVVRAGVLARSALPWDDVGQALTLARRAWRTECHGSRRPLAAWALGWASWWSGDLEAAATALEDALDGPQLVEVSALAVLARIHLQRGDLYAAEEHVAAAEHLVGERGLADLPQLGMIWTARGAVAAAGGSGAAALEPLERGIRLRRLWGHPLETADALAVAAPVVARERGRRAGGALLAEARRLLGACTDPGVLPDRLAAAARAALPRPTVGGHDQLTPRERAVLKLLARDHSKREIAQELDVSFNTVHSHTKAIYRKLGVSSRHEAVERASGITLR